MNQEDGIVRFEDEGEKFEMKWYEQIRKEVGDIMSELDFEILREKNSRKERISVVPFKLKTIDTFEAELKVEKAQRRALSKQFSKQSSLRIIPRSQSQMIPSKSMRVIEVTPPAPPQPKKLNKWIRVEDIHLDDNC